MFLVALYNSIRTTGVGSKLVKNSIHERDSSLEVMSVGYDLSMRRFQEFNLKNMGHTSASQQNGIVRGGRVNIHM